MRKACASYRLQLASLERCWSDSGRQHLGSTRTRTTLLDFSKELDLLDSPPERERERDRRERERV